MASARNMDANEEWQRKYEATAQTLQQVLCSILLCVLVLCHVRPSSLSRLAAALGVTNTDISPLLP